MLRVYLVDVVFLLDSDGFLAPLLQTRLQAQAAGVLYDLSQQHAVSRMLSLG